MLKGSLGFASKIGVRSAPLIHTIKFSTMGVDSVQTPSITELTRQLSQLGLKDKFTPYKDAHPANNIIDIFRSFVSQELAKISGADQGVVYSALDWSATPDKGDLLVPIPRLRIKGINPAEKSKEWAKEFPTGSFISKIVAQGPFLQFFFKPDVLFQLVIPRILSRKEKYGSNNSGEGKKVLVEFSSPNVAKPFHAGHLRSTIIGGFISNLYEANGWEVIRMNYLGDWGKQFGVLAVGFERFGSEEELQKDPINHLFNVYVKINRVITEEKAAIEEAQKTNETSEPAVSETDEAARAYFKKMENGDKQALDLWRRFRDFSISKYKDTYGRLNIEYDEYSGESQVPDELMKDATRIFEAKGLVEEDKGALLIDLTKHNKKLGKAVIQKKDGTSLYLTRDVGAAIDRYNRFHFDKMIYVIASQQDLHVAQLFKIMDLMDQPFAKDLVHINFGLVQGMSTRRGTVVFLDNILEEAKDSMHEVMKRNADKYAQVEDPETVADIVGRSAVMIQDMQAKRINNYKFDWSRILTFEGDTGPYLQYAHSRLCSVERRAFGEYNITESDLLNADLSLLVEPVAELMVRTLAQYPDVILQSTKTLEPANICTYLFKIAHLVSSAYDVLWVAGQNKDIAIARLALYSSARQVINNGMRLLGLTPVERM